MFQVLAFVPVAAAMRCLPPAWYEITPPDNRREFEEQLAREVERAQRFGTPVDLHGDSHHLERFMLEAWHEVTTVSKEQAVAALEQQWLQSQKTNNPDLVAPLLAEKFVNTGSDGKVTSKAESLANAKATKYDSVDYENLKVTVFGDTAIATGLFTAKGTDPSGKPLDMHERFTDTWVKMPNGKWQCVASHGSPVKL